MASPERFEVPVSHLTKILPKEGLPHQKLKKKSLFQSDFKAISSVLSLCFFQKKKKINGKLVCCWPHPPTLTENSVNFCQAQPQLNSTQFQIQLRLRWFYFHLIQHPPAGKVSIETGEESNQKGLIQDHFRTTSSYFIQDFKTD